MHIPSENGTKGVATDGNWKYLNNASLSTLGPSWFLGNKIPSTKSNTYRQYKCTKHSIILLQKLVVGNLIRIK